jgi:hypothetical protein
MHQGGESVDYKNEIIELVEKITSGRLLRFIYNIATACYKEESEGD